MVGEDGIDVDEKEERKSKESERKSNPNQVKEGGREEGEEEEGRTIRGPKAIYICLGKPDSSSSRHSQKASHAPLTIASTSISSD